MSHHMLTMCGVVSPPSLIVWSLATPPAPRLWRCIIFELEGIIRVQPTFSLYHSPRSPILLNIKCPRVRGTGPNCLSIPLDQDLHQLNFVEAIISTLGASLDRIELCAPLVNFYSRWRCSLFSVNHAIKYRDISSKFGARLSILLAGLAIQSSAVACCNL